MNDIAELEAKLDTLAESYRRVNGVPFQHFSCPLLFRDEPVELCKAHLLNKAFPGTLRRWTVQRKDVDNWFGRHFEGDFAALKYRDFTIDQILTDETASKRLPLQITYKGQQVKSYRPSKQLPADHTKVELQLSTASFPLALELEPDHMLQTREEHWQVAVEKDLRVPSLVSLLKSAHLTLFDMLGYEYALSAGGTFLGKTILGDFYLKNRAKSKRDVLGCAFEHFSEYANLVRPVLTPNLLAVDTISKHEFYIVEDTSRWGIMVCLHIAGQVHAVITPFLESADSAARFFSFL